LDSSFLENLSERVSKIGFGSEIDQ
jgi:hypothetical protein